MAIHERAGQPATSADLVDVDALIDAYFDDHPDVSDPTQQVAFGTSGHRGSSLSAAFNEDHIVAISQAICEYRAAQGTDGPLFLGRDPHALSEPAAQRRRSRCSPPTTSPCWSTRGRLHADAGACRTRS